MNKTETAMNNMKFQPKNIDDYISIHPKEVQKLLQTIRTTIAKAAPDAEEAISYQIPTFKLKGNLVHFAAFKNHLGFYPGADGVATFKKELSKYETSKGTIQFPFDQPLPLKLISDIVKYRVIINQEKAKAKSKPKPSSKKKTSDADQVEQYLKTSDPKWKEAIAAIRKIIKSVDTGIAERIKWNATSYHFLQQDMVTFGPVKSDKVLLVFHHPCIVKIKSDLLEGDYKDRRLVYFTSLGAVKKNKPELTRIVKELVKAIENKLK
ncbi:MAG: DUF1801 domain-containing protein [Flammeovirgaceae bacterium]|nr:DUF1801 domain-containing protein [Flammeovirgaceae bacterium]